MYDTISEESISALVDSFYNQVRDDQLLGPIFADAIGPDWGPHLAKMKRFWSSVALATRTYKGNPMLAHLQLPRLTGTHFERWLELWRKTCGDFCSPELAEFFVGKAEMIGERLLYAITAYHDSAAREASPALQKTT